MSGILGHIVGMDEIHKKNLLKNLPPSIKVIDLDIIQQSIYEGPELVQKKKEWSDLSQTIIIKKKQKILIGQSKSSNIDKDIQKLIKERNNIKKIIHDIWKEKLSNKIDDQINKLSDFCILFIGFNIFPKDYRVRINLPIKNLTLTNLNTSNLVITNKIIFDIKPNGYATNQIKFYLDKYSERIIQGKFPLDLLNTTYLMSKYDKFTQFYAKLGYSFVNNKQLLDTIIKFCSELESYQKISNKIVYVVTMFKCVDTIPVMAGEPIEGFLSREEAINKFRSKVKKPIPIYVYQISADQFEMVDRKLVSKQELYPMEEESIMFTV